MRTLLTSFSLLAVVLVTFSTCGEDNLVEADDLEGRWVIKEGYRDGEKTTTMEGMYFFFTADGQFQTNMLGAEESFAYELDGDRLLQREGSMDADYKIESYADREMVLTTELRRKPFRMVLQKEQ